MAELEPRGDQDLIQKDVVIIGGGSSGTYAAIRLQELGHSIFLIEQQSHLGGHVDTFHDPATGRTFDNGVVAFTNIPVVVEYFKSLNVPLLPRQQVRDISQKLEYANTRTDGKFVPADARDWVRWTSNNSRAFVEAMRAYREQVAQYPCIDEGWDLPNPIPSDLLLPFGDFLQKHNLSAMAAFSFVMMGGLPNILTQPTVYVMKSIHLNLVDSMLGTGAASVTTAHNNQALYDSALERLGDNVSVSSKVTAIRHEDGGVQVSVSTPSSLKVIRGKKLLVAVQPTLKALKDLDLCLDAEEEAIFAQFNHSYFWSMMIRDSGLQMDTAVATIDLSTEPLAIPAEPGVYSIAATGIPGLHTCFYSSSVYLSASAVKQDTLATLSKIVSVNGLQSDKEGNAEIVNFRDNSPYVLTVSGEAIKDGFYERLKALQGKKNVWWTGAVWQGQDSSQIWNWMERSLLPRIVTELRQRSETIS